MIAPIESIATIRKSYFTCAEITALIKQNLGYNSRQISVSKRNNLNTIILTVRDASVDMNKVQAFANNTDSWTLSQNCDSGHGQSIDVKLTKEVEAIHAAPFIEEIKLAAKSIDKEGGWANLSNGKVLNLREQRLYVSSGLLNSERGCPIWKADVLNGESWAITALAVQMANV